MEINNLSTEELYSIYKQLVASQTTSSNVSTLANISTILNASESQESSNTSEADTDIVDDALYNYLSSKSADENATIPSFSGYQYTSTSYDEAPLIAGSELINPKDYVVGAIIIDPEVNKLAGDLYNAHAANYSVSEWKAVVEQAILANGGLGTSEDGFLAWSKDGHFVRLRNTNLTPEQNQKLASYSLEFGWPVEDMPSSISENILNDETKLAEVDAKLQDFDNKIEAFRQNPEMDFTVKYGKRRFQVSYDAQTGAFASISYKKHSGLKGLIERCFSGLSKGLGWVSKITSKIPTWWTQAINAVAKIGQGALTVYGSRGDNAIRLNKD